MSLTSNIDPQELFREEDEQRAVFLQNMWRHVEKFTNPGISVLVTKYFDFFYRPEFGSPSHYRSYMIGRIELYQKSFLEATTELQNHRGVYNKSRSSLLKEISTEFVELIYDGEHIPEMALARRKELALHHNQNSHHHLATGTEGSRNLRHRVSGKVHDLTPRKK